MRGAGLGGSPLRALAQIGPALVSARDFAGLVAEEDAVDDGADGLLFVMVEVGDGFEAEVPFVVVAAGFVGVEDELIGVGVERGCESSDDVEGGLCCALFVSADLGDVDADAFGEGCLGESLVVSEVGEAFVEVHGDDHLGASLSGERLIPPLRALTLPRIRITFELCGDQ